MLLVFFCVFFPKWINALFPHTHNWSLELIRELDGIEYSRAITLSYKCKMIYFPYLGSGKNQMEKNIFIISQDNILRKICSYWCLTHSSLSAQFSPLLDHSHSIPSFHCKTNILLYVIFPFLMISVLPTCYSPYSFSLLRPLCSRLLHFLIPNHIAFFLLPHISIPFFLFRISYFSCQCYSFSSHFFFFW